MSCNFTFYEALSGYGPEDQPESEEERRLFRAWFEENLNPTSLQLFGRHRSSEPLLLLAAEKLADSRELLRLLYPRHPALFHRPRRYKSSDIWMTSDSNDSPDFTLGCAALFALCGNSRSLRCLLELGCDPNGHAYPSGWEYAYLIPQPNSFYLLTPMDCALLTGQVECQEILKAFGGKTMGELCGMPHRPIPPELEALRGCQLRA